MYLKLSNVKIMQRIDSGVFAEITESKTDPDVRDCQFFICLNF